MKVMPLRHLVKSLALVETMSLFGMLGRTVRKTLKRGVGAVRRVGKVSSNIARRGTNAVGLTRRRRCKRGSRRR